MNPAMAQWWLSSFQQQPQQPQAPSGEPAMAPSQGEAMSPMPPSNPLMLGSQAAMQRAKESLQLDDNQRRRAMGSAIATTFGNMATGQSHGNGFAGALGDLSAGMSPAVNAYQQALASEEARNQWAFQHQIDAEKEAEKNQQWQQEMHFKIKKASEEEAYNRQKEAENKEYNKQYLDILRGKNDISEKKATGQGKNAIQTLDFLEGPKGQQIDIRDYPVFTSAAQRNQYSKDLRGLTDAEREVKNIIELLEQSYKESKDSIFSPIGSALGNIPNKGKEWLGKAGSALNPDKESVKNLNREVVLTNRLRSAMEQLQPQLERALKGSAPGEQLLKRFHEGAVYPGVSQSYEVNRAKLKDLYKMIGGKKSLYFKSLRSNRQLDYGASEGPDMEGEIQEVAPMQPQSVPMQAQRAPMQDDASTVERVLKQYPQFSNRPPEQILEWARSRGI